MSGRPISRRAVAAAGGALLLPAMLAGCDSLTDLLAAPKTPLPGLRQPVIAGNSALQPDAAYRGAVTVPPSVRNADWMQAGGNPGHAPGNLAASGLNQAWRQDFGESGGYRRSIPCPPVVAGGRVFSMDPDAAVHAHDLRSGEPIWRRSTRGPKDRSTNVGGGLSTDGATIFVATGRAEVLAVDPGTGAIRWRKPIAEPARCPPTIADGRLFVTTAADRLVALSATDGSRLWDYQAASAVTSVLGQPAPAYADGIVVAGFGSGDLVGLRADGGSVVWEESLASISSSNLAAISAVRGLPAIEGNRVFAIGLGGLMLSLDLRSGRRLWERSVAGGDTPWVAGDWIYVATASQQLTAINRNDGNAAWVTDLPRWTNPKRQTGAILWRGPVMIEGHLVTVSTDHTVQSRLAGTGEMVGQRVVPAPVTMSPVVADGTLLVLSDDGTMTAFR